MQRVSTYGIPEINDTTYDSDLQLHNCRVLSNDFPLFMCPESVLLIIYICFKLFWIHLSYIWKTPLTISAYPPNLRINGKFFICLVSIKKTFFFISPVGDKGYPIHIALNVYFCTAALQILNSSVRGMENSPHQLQLHHRQVAKEIYSPCLLIPRPSS